MFKTKAEIAASLKEYGFEASTAASIAALSKPGLQLHSVPSWKRLPKNRTGMTRIGGLPDLPEHIDWPWREPYPDLDKRIHNLKMLDDDSLEFMDREQIDATNENFKRAMAQQLEHDRKRRPLSFIAQFDLSDLNANSNLDALFPEAGRLLLFYDCEEQPWGYRPADSNGLRLIWDDTPKERIGPKPPPAALDETTVDWALRYSPVQLIDRETLTPIHSDAPELFAILTSWDRRRLYGDWLLEMEEAASLNGLSPDHRFAGWPRPIQNDMQLECQLVSNGLYLGDGAAYKTQEAKRLEPGAVNWMLVAQIDSDPASGFMWGDIGRIYVWIQKDDLKNRQFEKARLILQSY